MGGQEAGRGQDPWSQWGLNVSDEARHRGKPPRSRILVRRISIGVGSFLMVLSLVAVVAYKHLEGNIEGISTDTLTDRPDVETPKAINVLVMGSDTRDGANGQAAGGSTPGLSDTTMILHLSASRQFAYGISLPRDSMVQRPDCARKGGGISAGGLVQFNSAYAVGGPLCTVKTVEALTGIRMNHFVVIDFVGFKAMVNAINGVEVCVPEEVNDTIGNINLPAGTYTVTGEQALDYVRVRYGIGAPTGDIGRMKRQQAFIAAMIQKVVSAGTLANPVRLFKFLDAATDSLTTDQEFANLKQLATLGNSLKNIGLDKIQFLTVPFQAYEPDPNRVEWRPEAEELWSLIRKDKPITPQFADGALTAGPGSTPAPSASPEPTSTASPGATAAPSAPSSPSARPTKSQEQKDAEARAAGLCTS